MKEDYSKDQGGKPPTEQQLLHTFTQGASNRTSERRVLSTSSYEGHAKHIDNPSGSRPRSLRKKLERYLAARRHCHSVSSVPMRYAQGRVAVQLTATGTLRVEWQCTSHCHSMVNVRGRYAQGRVAVQPVRSGSSGSAGRDGPKLVSATSASGCALSEAGPKPYRERPLRERESLCNWVDATGWPFCRLQLGGLFAGWMVPFFAGWTVLWPVRLICSTCP